VRGTRLCTHTHESDNEFLPIAHFHYNLTRHYFNGAKSKKGIIGIGRGKVDYRSTLLENSVAPARLTLLNLAPNYNQKKVVDFCPNN